MSILSAIKEVKRDNNNLQDMALLPQALIMQMAQRGEIEKDLVPLILSKKAEIIEAEARNKALARSGQPPMPTVMEQKMAQIAQAENPAPEPQMMPQQMAQMPAPQLPEEVGIAQNPVPPMQMAGGGIIAFSGEDGSYVKDDDDDDDETDALIFGLMQNMRTRSGRAAPSVGIASKYEDKEGRSDDIVDRLRAQIMAKESGGRRYDKSGKLLTSSKGAEGEMQVMPYTARDPGFGIRPARDGSPEELRRVGDEYAAAMYKRYGDPKLAMIAYNMGPGATDKWLASGANIRDLPKETQGYIRGVSLAEGGEVKGYAGPEGSVVETEEPSSVFDRLFGGGDRLKEYQNRLARQQEFERVTREQPGFFQKTTSAERNKAEADLAAAEAARRGPRSAKPSGETFVDPDITALQKRKDYDKNKKIDTSGEGIQNIIAAKREELTPEQELFNEIRADLKARRAALEAGRNMDKWQAGLAAGLGMLGGESPYAMVNIGKGGQMGVQQLADLRKLRAAEEAAIGSGYGSLYKNQLIAKLKDAQIADTKAYRETQLNDARNKAVERAVNEALKLGPNAQKQNLLNALEMQESKLDKDKLAELNKLRKWRRDLEAGIRSRMSSSSESSGVIKLD